MSPTTLETNFRAWLVAMGASGGIPNADRAVVIADLDGPKPAAPVLIVRVVVYDVPVHQDQDLYDATGGDAWRARGLRTSTVSVNAFGVTAANWLERATLMVRSPASQAMLGVFGLAVRAEGGLNNLSRLLDSHTESRWQRDFLVDYVREGAVPGDTEGIVPLEQVVYDADWGDREETVTEVLT